MTRRPTLYELYEPAVVEFTSTLASSWGNDAVRRLFEFVWLAYDALAGEVLDSIDWSGSIFDLERSVTELLEPRLHRVIPGHAPVYAQHASAERETALRRNEQPPTYDIAFVLRGNEKIKLPLEAKVLKNADSLADYINEIRYSYRTCRYAPFSSEGAMLAYLMSGSIEALLKNISKALRRPLETTGAVTGRPHRTSLHKRKVKAGKTYPRKFRCHHLVMPIRREVA